MINGYLAKQNSNMIHSVSLWLIIFLCIFIPFRSPISELTSSAIKSIPDLLITGLLVWYVVSIRFKIKVLFHDWMFVGFIAIGFISNVFINHIDITTFIFQVRSIGLYYVLYFVVRNLYFGKKEYTCIVKVLQYVSIVLFAFAVIEKITNKDFLFSTKIAESIIYADNFARVYSLFYNPNTYGLFLVFVLFMTYFLKFYFNIETSVYVHIVLIVSLLLSMSRSSIIIYLIGIIVLAIFRFIIYKSKFEWKKTLKSTIVLFIGVIVVYLGILSANKEYHDFAFSEKDSKTNDSMYIGIFDRFDELGEKEIVKQSLNNGRFFSIKIGLKVFNDNKIFGSGFGTYGSAASLNKEPVIYKKYDITYPFYSDNEYIKVLAESGTLGMMFFILFLCGILFRYKKDFFKLFFSIMVIWFGLFYNVFEVQIAALLFWVMLSFNEMSHDKFKIEKSKEKEVVNVNS